MRLASDNILSPSVACHLYHILHAVNVSLKQTFSFIWILGLINLSVAADLSFSIIINTSFT